MSRPPVFVLGVGFAGLVAAAELAALGIPATVLEAQSTIGGLAASHERGPIRFDTGAHFVTNRLATAIGVMDQCDTVARYGEAVWLNGRSAAYPLGLMCSPRYTSSALAHRLRPTRPVRTASDRFRAQYGDALTEQVAAPLIEAWSGLPADRLAPSVVDKIPGGIAETIALTAARRLTHRPVAIGYCGEAPQSANVWHVYPREGLGVFTQTLADRAESIQLDTPIETVHVRDGKVTGVRVDGTDHAAAAVISTLPAPTLARIVDHPAIAPLATLRFRPMVFAMMHLRGRGLLPEPVTWVPDPTLPFFRLTETPMAMPWVAPPGETVLTVDFGAEIDDDIWTASESTLTGWIVDGLRDLIPDLAARHIATHVARTPIAYPVFALETETARRTISRHGIRGLVSAGRNAEFGHYLMEDVYWRTLRTARAVASYVAG